MYLKNKGLEYIKFLFGMLKLINASGSEVKRT